MSVWVKENSNCWFWQSTEVWQRPFIIGLQGKSSYCTYIKEDRICSLNEIIKEGACPILINSLIPYYVSLHGEACFSWSQDSEGVLVLCPEPAGGVVVNIKRRIVNGKKKVIVLVKEASETCICNYKPEFEIGMEKVFEKICPLGFRIILSGLLYDFKEKQTPLKLQCPLEDCSVVITFDKFGSHIP